MRTRTLLLLAVACGLAILVAGVAQLLRLGNQDESTPAAIGETVRVADMEVTVEAVGEREDRVLVDIEIGGVDDADGADGFDLVVSSGTLRADETAGNHCGATTVAVQPCTLAFRLGDDAGSSRVLVYRRGEEQAHWDLGAG